MEYQDFPICQLESVPAPREETGYQPEDPLAQFHLQMVTNQRDSSMHQQLSISNMPIMQHNYQDTQPHVQVKNINHQQITNDLHCTNGPN
jgi:hypothetical protein